MIRLCLAAGRLSIDNAGLADSAKLDKGQAAISATMHQAWHICHKAAHNGRIIFALSARATSARLVQRWYPGVAMLIDRFAMPDFLF